MSGRKKWSDVKHKCTPEQLAKARAELEDEMRAYEATPTQGGASSEGNDEEPDFRQLRDAARRGCTRMLAVVTTFGCLNHSWVRGN